MVTLFAQWIRGLLSNSGTARAGAWGEWRAARWLQRERGFTVIARNWRNPRDRRQEIDLVCRDGGVLVFVEVKARAAEALVGGYFAVDRRKRRVLRRVVAAYLRRLRVRPHTFRFDVVEVTSSNSRWGWLGGRRTDVRHFENIPLFSKHFRP